MKEQGILDILYKEICEGIKIPASLNGKTIKIYDKMLDLFKQYTANENAIREFEELFAEFEDAEMDEFLYERKEVFKEAYKTSEMLKKELGAMRVVVTDDEVTFNSDMLEQLYEARVEEVAQIIEEEKARDKEQIKHIAFNELAPKLTNAEIKKVDNAISEYVDSLYSNFGDYNKKYYINGFKDSFGLTFVCSRKR